MGPRDSSRITQATDYFQIPASGKFLVAPSGTFTIPVADVPSLRGVFIEAKSGFNLAVNTQPVQEIRPPTTQAGVAQAGSVCQFRSDSQNLTSLVITNPSTTVTLDGFYRIWGAPIA